MTRASLGHTGRPLTASPATIAIFVIMFLAAIARIMASLLPDQAISLMSVAGIAWVGAFLGFAVHYGPVLVSKRVDA